MTPADEAIEDPATEDEAEAPTGRARRLDLGTVLFLLTMAWGAGIASYPLTDNSFLTHLATGRLILDRGSVPSTDPYSFTAQGAEWTVQSWLASVAYAGAERIGGVVGLRVLVLVLFLAGAALLWRLSRPCQSLVPRIAIVFASLYIVTGLWGERPYMVGVIGLGIVWLALEGAVAPGWLIPLYWLWANSHGSYPLGLALVVVVLIGRRMDRLPTDRARRVLAFSVIGTLTAVISPLGLEVLLFPFTALTKSDVLREVVEWQPATYSSMEQRLFLVLAFVTVLALIHRPSWRLALPTVMFVGAAIVAQRNIVMAVMILVPVLAESAPSFGRLTVSRRPNLLVPYVGVGAIALVGAIVYSLMAPFGELENSYPVRQLARIESTPLADERMATQDIVGNLLHVLDGEDAESFVDDRVDMYPEEVIYDGLGLLRGQADWQQILDEYDIEVVVWERSRPLASLLASDPGWRVVFSDTDWLLACRRGSASCDSI